MLESEEIAKASCKSGRIKQLKHQRDIYMSLLKVGEAFLKHGRWGGPRKTLSKWRSRPRETEWILCGVRARRVSFAFRSGREGHER